MDIDKIRNLALTEDAKMAIIADFVKKGGAVVERVDLSSLAGMLSDEDFAKVQQDNCVVTVGTQYYYKQYSAATVIKYGAIPRASANKAQVIFDYVDIDKSTKTYEVGHEEVPAA